MTRRMKANPHMNGFGLHANEHDEFDECPFGDPCEPVEETPMTAQNTWLYDSVNALLLMNDRWVRQADVLNLVKDTVAVPDTGTYIVADGVVHTPNDSRDVDTRDLTIAGRGVTRWIIDVEKPKPTFFEEGKIYRYKSNREVTFKVKSVEENGDGRKVAFGLQDGPVSGKLWSTLNNFDFWQET